MALITTGLTNGGLTDRFALSYDDSLSTADGVTRANAVLQYLEEDLDYVADFYGRPLLKQTIPIQLRIMPGTQIGGATWNVPPAAPSYLAIQPGTGTTAVHCRYLIVCETVEMYGLAQNIGWFVTGNEGIFGEAMSRLGGIRFLVDHGYTDSALWRFAVAPSYLASARADYLHINPQTPTDFVADGCTTLFLFYLQSQLGFTHQQMVAAGGNSCAELYENLTGDPGDPFPLFKAMLDAKYPGTTVPAYNASTIPSLVDNPWPLTLPGGPMRRPFGGTTNDYVTTVTSGVPHVAAVPVTFWTARSGGTRITDLAALDGGGITQVTTDIAGQVPPFQGPYDGTQTMWADAGGPNRVLMQATDITARLAVLETSGGGGGSSPTSLDGGNATSTYITGFDGGAAA